MLLPADGAEVEAGSAAGKWIVSRRNNARARAFVGEHGALGVVYRAGDPTPQFPTRVRYAGASVAYTFAGVFAGGIAPLVFTALYSRFHATMPLVLYAAGAVIVTLLALAGAGNTHRHSD